MLLMLDLIFAWFENDFLLLFTVILWKNLWDFFVDCGIELICDFLIENRGVWREFCFLGVERGLCSSLWRKFTASRKDLRRTTLLKFFEKLFLLDFSYSLTSFELQQPHFLTFLVFQLILEPVSHRRRKNASKNLPILKKSVKTIKKLGMSISASKNLPRKIRNSNPFKRKKDKKALMQLSSSKIINPLY